MPKAPPNPAKPIPESYNVRLSPKAVAALDAYAKGAGISRTRALTDLVEHRLAGTRPAWFGERDHAAAGPGAALEDRLAEVMRATIEGVMERSFRRQRASMVEDNMRALQWAVMGPDRETPDWARPYAGRVGQQIGRAFFELFQRAVRDERLGR
jgi:hypothetical protein